jgi:hypothetical protein
MPCTGKGSLWPVHEVEVNIVQAELLQAFIQGCLWVVMALKVERNQTLWGAGQLRLKRRHRHGCQALLRNTRHEYTIEKRQQTDKLVTKTSDRGSPDARTAWPT